MALMRDLSQAQIAFQIKDGDPDQFQVMRYRGTEGLSQLYRFEIEAVSHDADIDLDKAIRTSARLTIRTGEGERVFHGVIGRIEFAGETAHGQAYYRIELVPEIWILTHRYNNRIYQQKTVQEIISDVVTRSGLPSDYLALRLNGSYQPREYCVQYRETDFNFISRLMEEEGIWYFFEHGEQGHKMVLADDKSAYRDIPGDPRVPFHPPAGMDSEVDHVFRFRKGQGVRPGGTVLNDWNFTHPTLNLEGRHDLGRDAGLEFYDYPGEYDSQAQGRTYARLRAEEFETGRVLAVGQTNCGRFAPGTTFELFEHPSSLCNGKYLITSVTHQGKQATTQTTTGGNGRTSFLDARVHQALLAAARSDNVQIRELAEGILQLAGRLRAADPTAGREKLRWLYHAGQMCRDLAIIAQASGYGPLEALTLPNLLDDAGAGSLVDFDAPVYEARFECIPAEVNFRPPRVTPWPVMRGCQTARVVGPGGEEIYTDEYGRVKVQFHWDREGQLKENASCWIRCSQGMAGGQYGMMFLPRVGQEVIVDFLEGNPDNPIIVGRVFNGDHKPPYKLPDEKTKSVIKTHSSKGGGGTNEIRFEDLKDKEQILIRAQKDLHVRALNQERHNVGEKQFLIVADEQRVSIGSHQSVKVGGRTAVQIADSLNVKVGGDVLQDFQKNYGQQVASEYYIKAGKLIVEADSGISLKVGGNFVLIDAAGVTIVGSMVKINSGGSALTKSVNVSPASPAAPEEADDVTPGQDVSYTGEKKEPPRVSPKPYQGHWVAIQLKDRETGQPVPGEYYEIKTPSGKVIKGTLDVNGYARQWIDEPGNCEITFPNRDREEWSRG